MAMSVSDTIPGVAGLDVARIEATTCDAVIEKV